ncbi:MAG: TolC family protein [Sulfurimonas sp.]|uniref:TolC family protein n=1 Tax=Sulfurimonas sp. TaxID=2022749 RepID=UPI00260357F3|nr:TolC family protein [Sulfurimonas sp.]MDD2652376.1 TolC family protein [Sulfurimonas sp.]MDD3451148.1 TolC family protein [Sulfurimonas sp.]
MKKTLLLFLSCFTLYAKTLTVDSCIEAALQNHPDIKRLSLSSLQSGSLVDIAKADYLPQLNLNAQYNPHNTFTLQQNGTFNTIEDDNFIAEAKVTQKIYDFSKTASTIEAYEKNKNVTALSLEEAKSLLAFSVKNLYNKALFQTKALKTRQKDIETKEELYKQAEALVREGLKTKADASSMLSALYNAKDAYATTKAELDKAVATLFLYMGEEADLSVTLEENAPTTLQSANALDTIFAKNPSLLGLSEQITRDTLLYNASKAANYGSVDAVASYTYQDSLSKYDTSMLGIGINIPLYSGGRLSAQNEYTRIEKEKTKESYKAKKLQLEEQTLTLIADLKRYKATIEAKEALINSSLATKEIVEARYKEGLSTYIEVLDAATTHLQAQLGLLEARFALQNIQNNLEYLQGEKK